MRDGKPVFGTKASTTETPSLFDSHRATAASGELPQAVGVSQGAVAEPASKSDPEIETAARLPGL